MEGGMPPGMGLPPGMFGGMGGMPPGMGLPPHMHVPLLPTDDLPDGPPAVSEEATAIVAEFASDVDGFHSASEGRVSKLHHLLNSVAHAHNKPPLPPRALGAIFAIEEGQRRSAEEGGTRVTVQQIMGGLAKMVNDKEGKEKFEKSVIGPMRAETARLQNTKDIMSELTPRLEEYHAKVEGETGGLFALVRELMPEDVRAAFPQAAFCTELMHVPPGSQTIPLPRFLAGIEDNLDEDDTIEGIAGALDKLMA